MAAKKTCFYIFWLVCSTSNHLNAKLEFSNSDALFNLKTNNAKLKFSNVSKIYGWDKQQIISSNANDTPFLYDNIIWRNDNGNFNAPIEAFEFVNDLTIPNSKIINITQDRIIDGQGHSLTFGTTSQILIESGITLTLKNLTLKNKLNPFSIPPVRCIDWNSTLVLDNVKFALNDDFAFKTGQIYIHNDVVFTGSSKFIYQSVKPSYIQPHSTLYFDEQTTLDYSPSSTLKDLIVLSDKTSSIHLNGSTLQTTHTGIKLTKGRLLLENKVTLSGASNNIIYDITYSGTPIHFGDRIDNADLDPSNRYLAFSGYNTNHSDLQIHYFDGSVLTGTPIAQKEIGYAIRDINWSPDGKHLAIATNFPAGGDELQIYSFDNGDLNETPIASRNFGTYLYNSKWHPSGKYVAISGRYPDSGAQLQIYSFDNNVLSQNSIYSEVPMGIASDTKWHPKGEFLAVAGQNSDTSTALLKIYSFYDNTLSGTPIETRGYGTTNANVSSIDWSPDGNYLVIGGTTDGVGQIQIYSFYNNQLSAYPISEAHNGVWDNFIELKWNPNGKYISVAQQNNATTSVNEFQIFKVDNGIISSSQVTGFNYGYQGHGTIWTTDSKYLFCYGRRPFSGYELQQYKINYAYDTTQQTVSNAIILGNSNKGSDYNLNVSILGGAQGIIDGYVWYDSTNSTIQGQLDFANKSSSLSLKNNNSKLKFSSINNVQGWQKQQVSSAPLSNTTFLYDNMIWGDSSRNFGPPNQEFEFVGDLTIPANQLINITKNRIIDGQKKSLILGNNAQILIDSGVTLTLKNLTLKNNSNPISIPPIKCLDQQSKLVLDNVKFALNDDFKFKTGQMYIYNDVIFTGTSKLIYQSVLASYIQPHSTLYFDNETTFEYHPSSNKKDLIILTDETSSIYLNGATLQTTHTGIRLNKGRLFLDNKVTLSSAAITKLVNATLLTSKNFGTQINAIAWSQDKQYLAIGGAEPDSGLELQIYSFKNDVLTSYTSKNYGTTAANSINGMEWSPDGKYLAIGGDIPTSGSELQIYSFINGELSNNPIDSKDYGAVLYFLSWSPNGKYLALGGFGPTSGNELQVYSFANGKLSTSPIDSKNYGNDIKSISWSPNGNFLAVGGQTPDSGHELQIYSFQNGTLTLYTSKNYGSNLTSVKWSPDGQYLALGGSGPTSGNELEIYSFINNQLSANPVSSKNYGNTIYTVGWSPDGQYLAIGGATPTTGDELQIYSFNNGTLSTNPVDQHNYGTWIYCLSWDEEGKYLAIGGTGPPSGNELQLYKANYTFDTSTQTFNNSIIFGDSAKGSEYNLNSFVLGGARVEMNGIAWFDDAN